MRLPTFLIIGAQRSGTTYLWSLLKSHPDILLPDHCFPEPKFFSLDTEYQQGLSHYARHFQGAQGSRAIGEKSVTYLDSPVAAQRIREVLPAIKLICLLRNPVDRAYSHYRYSCAHCLESLCFGDALLREPYRACHTPTLLAVTKPWAYVERGRYATQLQRFMACFPPEQLLVLFYEEFFADLEAHYRTICTFLSIPAPLISFPPPTNGIPVEDPMAPYLRDFLLTQFAEEQKRLEDLLGRSVPEIWRQAS